VSLTQEVKEIREKLSELEFKLKDPDEEAVSNDAAKLREKGFNARVWGEDPEQAIKFYQQALEIDPDYVKALIEMGIAKKDIGDHKGALDAFNKAEVIRPGNPDIYRFRGDLYYSMGEMDKASKDYSRCMNIVDADFKKGT